MSQIEFDKCPRRFQYIPLSTTLTSRVNKDGSISHESEVRGMIRPVLFNKLLSELNSLRLKMVTEERLLQDRRDLNELFDLIITELYTKLKVEKRK